ERENAEQIVEEALHYLNTQKDEPGFRFAQHVSARLEIVMDAEQAEDRLQTDDDLAMMILHGLDDDEKMALTRACERKNVPVCHTVEGSDKPRKKPRRSSLGKRIMKVVFREKKDDGPRAHTILESTLTGPLEDDDQEDLGDRV